MEEGGGKGDLHVNLFRQGPSKSPLSLKTSLSGKSSPRSSPSFRRLGSSRTPRRDSRAGTGRFPWIGNNRVVFWLILITLWAYFGFYVQSQWAHGDHNKAEFVGYKSEQSLENAVKVTNDTNALDKGRLLVEGKKGSDSNFGVNLMRKVRKFASQQKSPGKKGRRSRRTAVKPREVAEENQTEEMEELNIPRKNTTYGLVVGPFGKIEDSILGWSPEKRRGTCNRKGEFARLVWSRRFVLVFHELSMTGAPLSMLELATEMLSCGATVTAIILSRKGGLMGELERRGIKVLQDREKPSFKVAMKVDLIIAGSAVCSSWIGPYLDHFPAGAGQIVWWIMENRREYFDRSKHLLNRVKMLTFLSESQSKQWLSWCEEEKMKFYLQPMIVPLSVNDELAFVAGLPCSLNTPASSVEKMMEKRDLLRSAVRKEIGLNDNDMLVMTLSSINPSKGQRLLLEASLSVAEHNVTLKDPKNYELLEENKLSGVPQQNQTIVAGQLNPGDVLQATNQTNKAADSVQKSNPTRQSSKKKRRKRRTKTLTDEESRNARKLLSVVGDQHEETLKVLIGSVGSKSNKVIYVKAILRFISEHSNMSKTVLWTPATTRVAALYAAADVYVINAQGLGETFGRVTIEAMAFGLPVLGTDAGGTKEIVDHRVSGLLHPVGHEGTEVLAQHIQYLLSNPSVRRKMGINGRKKVQDMYLKTQTYESFAKVLFKCMRPK